MAKTKKEESAAAPAAEVEEGAGEKKAEATNTKAGKISKRGRKKGVIKAKGAVPTRVQAGRATKSK
jgi:hypothetical protein